MPLRNPDFSPFLQKVADAKPDALFVFVPSGPGRAFMKQFLERGLDKSGIRLIATGDVTDDDQLNGMGDVALGVVTTHHYSANHDSPENKAFVEAFKKANNGLRPNFMAVGGYDGMHLIYEALKKTNGSTDGDALIAAMKGMKWESPRGPISIDPETRDIIQNIYIRKVEKVNGELYNVEFATIPNVKDPVKAAKMPRAVRSGARRTPGQRRNGVHADDPVRRRRLRHAAVRAGLRACGDAGVDELRQPRARRLRHGGRLRHRAADEPARRAVPGLPAGGLRDRGGPRPRARAHALSSTCMAAAISTRCCSRSASCSWRWRRSTT